MPQAKPKGAKFLQSLSKVAGANCRVWKYEISGRIRSL